MALKTIPYLQLVGEAVNGLEALALCKKLRPDVVLMDLVMPQMDGVTAITEIHKKHPEIQVIALSTFSDTGLVRAAIEAGAISYLLKNVLIDELALAIRAAYDKKPTLAQEAAEALVHAAHSPNQHDYKLSRREYEVLELMVQGLNNIEIALHLSISRSTVKKHVTSIFNKLNSSSRTEAIALAIQRKLISTESSR